MNWFKWMLQWIYAYIFGCFHRHTTWPHRNPAGFDYIRCLDCGTELPYSLRQMRIVTSEELLEECDQETATRGRPIGRKALFVFSRKGVLVPRNISANAQLRSINSVTVIHPCLEEGSSSSKQASRLELITLFLKSAAALQPEPREQRPHSSMRSGL